MHPSSALFSQLPPPCAAPVASTFAHPLPAPIGCAAFVACNALYSARVYNPNNVGSWSRRVKCRAMSTANSNACAGPVRCQPCSRGACSLVDWFAAQAHPYLAHVQLSLLCWACWGSELPCSLCSPTQGLLPLPPLLLPVRSGHKSLQDKAAPPCDPQLSPGPQTSAQSPPAAAATARGSSSASRD